MQNLQDLNYSIETEPSVQPIRSINIQKIKRLVMKISTDSENVESDQSVDNSQYYRKQFLESYSTFTTKNSITGKFKSLNQLSNSVTYGAKLASIKRIKSFRLEDETYSQDEEESLPKELMKVNFQFRQDAIINVQKILQYKK